MLDPSPVTIGSNVQFGPAVQIYTATHPLNVVERRRALERAGAYRVYADPADLLKHLDEVGVRPAE